MAQSWRSLPGLGVESFPRGARGLRAQAVEILRKRGITRKFRGQSRREPKAPGAMCEFYPVETIHADRRRAIAEYARRTPRWRHGVGAPSRFSIRLAS